MRELSTDFDSCLPIFSTSSNRLENVINQFGQFRGLLRKRHLVNILTDTLATNMIVRASDRKPASFFIDSNSKSIAILGFQILSRLLPCHSLVQFDEGVVGACIDRLLASGRLARLCRFGRTNDVQVAYADLVQRDEAGPNKGRVIGVDILLQVGGLAGVKIGNKLGQFREGGAY
jgi:hypothetical protein